MVRHIIRDAASPEVAGNRLRSRMFASRYRALLIVFNGRRTARNEDVRLPEGCWRESMDLDNDVTVPIAGDDVLRISVPAEDVGVLTLE